MAARVAVTLIAMSRTEFVTTWIHLAGASRLPRADARRRRLRRSSTLPAGLGWTTGLWWTINVSTEITRPLRCDSDQSSTRYGRRLEPRPVGTAICMSVTADATQRIIIFIIRIFADAQYYTRRARPRDPARGHDRLMVPTTGDGVRTWHGRQRRVAVAPSESHRRYCATTQPAPRARG